MLPYPRLRRGNALRHAESWLQDPQNPDLASAARNHNIGDGIKARIQVILTCCEIQKQELNAQEPNEAAESTLEEAIRQGQEELTKRLTQDPQYSREMRVLDDLQCEFFVERYHDYFVHYLKRNRNVLEVDAYNGEMFSRLTTLQVTLHTLHGNSNVDESGVAVNEDGEREIVMGDWENINKVLKIERMLRAAGTGRPCNMHRTIRRVAAQLDNANTVAALSIISLHVDSEESSKLPLSEFIAAEHWFNLGKRIIRDLDWIQREGDTIAFIKPFVPAVMLAMRDFVNKHFLRLSIHEEHSVIVCVKREVVMMGKLSDESYATLRVAPGIDNQAGTIWFRWGKDEQED